MRRAAFLLALCACGGGTVALEQFDASDADTYRPASSDASAADAGMDVHPPEMADSASDAGADAFDGNTCGPVTDPCDCRAELAACAGYQCGVEFTCDGGAFMMAFSGQPRPGVACYESHRINGTSDCTTTDAAVCCP